jgi:expansin (peptidoglycan-binding protein)
MGRLQGNGSLSAGVIPTRYKRIPCPVPGNAYIWLRDGAAPYYFALSIVNTYGVGAVVNVEIMGSGGTVWTPMALGRSRLALAHSTPPLACELRVRVVSRL